MFRVYNGLHLLSDQVSSNLPLLTPMHSHTHTHQQFLQTHKLCGFTHTLLATLILEMSKRPLTLLDLLNLKQIFTSNPWGDLFKRSAVSCHVAARVHFLGHWHIESITHLTTWTLVFPYYLQSEAKRRLLVWIVD